MSDDRNQVKANTNYIYDLSKRITLLEEDRVKSPLDTHRQDQIAAIAGHLYATKAADFDWNLENAVHYAVRIYDAAGKV